VNDSAVIVLLADGLTPQALDDAIASGAVPELAALRDIGGLHVLTTVFPSVTGVAYIPMLTGWHPADAGVPGLRWYDRSRRLPRVLGYSRSYVGAQLRAIDDDLSPFATTAFELARGNALGSGSMITRGLRDEQQLDRGVRHAARVVYAHVTGSVARWAALEQALADELIRRVRLEKPGFVLASFTTGDKATHADGPRSRAARESLQLVDHVAASIRRDAERDGRWESMELWVVSDHGHSPVSQHHDIAIELRSLGVKVRSHPWTFPDRSEAAVMVSGNSMAHLYLGLEATSRESWPALRSAWEPRIGELLSHPAIDLVATLSGSSTVEVRRGTTRAEIMLANERISYRTTGGNPLGVEPFDEICFDEAHERTTGTEYPDGVVQLAKLVLAERSGDVVISASPGWDLRRTYEPIDHVSSHGALHAAHMLVPLVGNRCLADAPRRTADLYRLAAKALGRGKRLALHSTFAGTLSG
jgi:type I phosphodiesterase/nucleotide pyrophosphatase